jgi:hypothetical protein
MLSAAFRMNATYRSGSPGLAPLAPASGCLTIIFDNRNLDIMNVNLLLWRKAAEAESFLKALANRHS